MTTYTGPETTVTGSARVIGSGRVYHQAKILDRAVVSGNAHVMHDAVVSGCASVSGAVQLMENAHVFGIAHLDGLSMVGRDAEVFSSNHVITIDGFFEGPVTVYRTATGHRVQAGCQNFTLTDDLTVIADEHDWYLPAGWEKLRDFLLESTTAWHTAMTLSRRDSYLKESSR